MINYINLLFLVFLVSCTETKQPEFNIIDEAKSIILDWENTTEMTDKEFDTLPAKKETEDVKTYEDKNPDPTKKEKNISETNKIEEPEYVEKKLIDAEKKIMEEEIIIESRLIEQDKEIIENLEKDDFIFEDKERGKMKIGVLLPLSGSKSDMGKLILNSLELALFQAKDADIELIVKDTKADSKSTLSAFKELRSKNIETFIGPLYSNSLSVIFNQKLEEDIKVFSLSNNINFANNNIWLFGIDPQQQTKRVLEYSINKGNFKIGALLPNNPYGYLLVESIDDTLRPYDITLEKVEYYDNNIKDQEKAAKNLSLGFSDYEEKLESIKRESDGVNEEEKIQINVEDLEKPLDAVFIAASGQDLTILASQLQYNNVDPNKVDFMGISSWESRNILTEPALNGGYFTSTSNASQKIIKDLYKKVFKVEMNNIAMLGYDIMALIGSVVLENKKISSDILLNPKGFYGLRGLFRLNQNGRVERVFEIKKILRNKFVTLQKSPENFLSNY